MSGLEQAVSRTLSALGGPTVKNANMVLDAVYGHLRASEAQMISTKEAAAAIFDATAAQDYPVPAAYLPALPPSRPSPPVAFPTLAYSFLLGYVNLITYVKLLPFQKLESIYARESRTLQLHRNLCLDVRTILESALLTLYPNIPSEFGPAESLRGSIPAFPSVPNAQSMSHIATHSSCNSAPGEAWRLFLQSPNAVDLKLSVPLINTGTNLLPPFTLDRYAIYMTNSALWDEKSTFNTLSIVGAVLIPEGTFYDAPNFLVRELCARNDGAFSLEYSLEREPDSTTFTLRLPKGRSIAFIRAEPAVDRLVFSQPTLTALTSLSISDRLLPSTINILARAFLDALTSVEIMLDDRGVEAPHASLLAYRGPKFTCDNISVLKISPARIGPQVVSVPAGKVEGFVACAFPGLCDISYADGVRIDA